MTGLPFQVAALDVRSQVRLDTFELSHAAGVLGASGHGLADELGNDIGLGIIGVLCRGSFGQSHHTVADQSCSVAAVDFARC